MVRVSAAAAVCVSAAAATCVCGSVSAAAAVCAAAACCSVFVVSSLVCVFCCPFMLSSSFGSSCSFAIVGGDVADNKGAFAFEKVGPVARSKNRTGPCTGIKALRTRSQTGCLRAVSGIASKRASRSAGTSARTCSGAQRTKLLPWANQ